MKRLYTQVFYDHLLKHRQMVFIMGPRQVGKTTTAQQLSELIPPSFYFNWDNVNDRDLIVKGPKAIAEHAKIETLSENKPLVVFDEIHKYVHWRDFLKGFYDSYPDMAHIVVTGSGKLNVFSRGGDSLMGRYFPFRFHPLSVAEIVRNTANEEKPLWDEPKKIDEKSFHALWKYGGFPDPFLKQSDAFARRWRKLRVQQLFEEDIRDLTRVIDIDRMELLAEKLRYHVGSLVSFQTLSKQLRVNANTVRNWMSILKSLYYCYDIRPWSKNVTRSLLKEPKYYLWDWSLCPNEGAKVENMVASHLLKAVHFWTDLGLGDFKLHYIRDKEKREVDFLVSKDDEPWMLIEVKLSENKGISSSLRRFSEALAPEYTLQVVANMDYVDVNCFKSNRPMIVPLVTFLSQLV